MVELLLDAGADADIANMHNRTARQAARDQGMTLRPAAASDNDSPLATDLLTAASAGDVAEIAAGGANTHIYFDFLHLLAAAALMPKTD
jgi:hypothetical protein